jgi:hypothetical protein
MMGRLAAGLLVVIAAALAGAGVALAQPSAEDQERAGALVQQGIEKQAKKDADGAVALYKEAYCLIPEPALVYNIGTAYQEAGRAIEAQSYFRMYLKVDPKGDLARDAKAAIKALSSSASKPDEIASIDCQAAAVPVCIDGQPPVDGVCPPPVPEACPAGEERVGTVCVASAPAGGTGTTEGTVSKPGKGLFYAGIGTAGAGAVCLGVGIAFGIKAKGLSDDLTNNEGDWTPELLAKQQEGKDVERNQIIFTAVGGAALVGGAVMIYFGLRSGGGERASGSENESTARVVPFFTGDEAGVAFTGRY